MYVRMHKQKWQREEQLMEMKKYANKQKKQKTTSENHSSMQGRPRNKTITVK